MRKIILLLKVSVFVGFCASQDVTSTWPMGTYVPGVCVCAPKDQCAVGGSKDIKKQSEIKLFSA